MRNASEERLVWCEDRTGARIYLAVLYSLMCALGTPVNLLVIYLALSFKKLRTSSNAFIVNGCVADLLVCAFWMPHEVVLVSRIVPMATGHHTFKEALLFIGIVVSLLSHSLIALNRYVLITKVPATYLSVYQRRNTAGMISVAWLLPLLFLLPWLAVRQVTPVDCLPLRGPYTARATSYGAGVLTTTILVQTTIVLYCYFRIFRKVKSSVKRVSVLNFQIVNNLPYGFHRKDKRLGFSMLAVCGVFLLTTGPFFWVCLLGLFRKMPPAAHTVTWLVFSSLFVLNPLLYTWKNEEFRKALKSTVRGSSAVVSVEPPVVVVQAVSRHSSATT
ncbi:probable G-protein coupled receptor 88 [Polypterus senegalus]